MMKIIVKNMNCGHCIVKIQRQLLASNIEAEFDLPTKTVTVSDDEYEKAVAVIKAAGYTLAE
ncbi:MAG: heavy-metal-associated domain-containing protein [Erysipelotrichaceae bacterium]|jgi:copper chaperone CopZ|nr:heavy-metal-associated domain-containing protein [Erysipelotrichaceae bacterium]